MTIRRAVSSPDAPAAIGPYSQAVWSGDQLHCAGQTPIDPATGALIDGDVQAQTRRVFANLEAVLTAAGLSLGHVVKCNVYLTTMHDFPAMNEAYKAAFTAPFPARTTVAVAGLPLGARVEIECIARRA